MEKPYRHISVSRLALGISWINASEPEEQHKSSLTEAAPRLMQFGYHSL